MKTDTAMPSVNKARDAAVAALLRLDRQRWLPVDVDTRDLDHRDGQLARAIYRTALQRKITLDMLLNTLVPRMTPAVRCILEAAAAQLLFLDRLPDYAVIDTAVRQAKALDKPAAGKVVNAVCRNIQRGIVERKDTGGWPGELDTLPVGGGTFALAASVA
jgi:transcription termination factor NusB